MELREYRGFFTPLGLKGNKQEGAIDRFGLCEPPYWSALDDSWRSTQIYSESTAGWPFRAFVGRLWSTNTISLRSEGKINIGRVNGKYRRLPVLLIWPGFLANTVIYGVVFVLLALLLGVGRGARRTHHGRCPTCNYDLTHNLIVGCPECGWNRASG